MRHLYRGLVVGLTTGTIGRKRDPIIEGGGGGVPSSGAFTVRLAEVTVRSQTVTIRG